MKALVLDADKCTANVLDITKPAPSHDEVLIKVEVVALNPVDSLYVFNPLGATGRVVGSDFAGTICSIGTDVPSSSGLEDGTRVAAFVQGACSVNQRPGAFAEYVTCPWDLVWKVPSTMNLEKAVTISLCGLTAAQAFFYRMGLPAPFQWPNYDQKSSFNKNSGSVYFFIYGASTSVGLYAAQLVSIDEAGNRAEDRAHRCCEHEAFSIPSRLHPIHLII